MQIKVHVVFCKLVKTLEMLAQISCFILLAPGVLRPRGDFFRWRWCVCSGTSGHRRPGLSLRLQASLAVLPACGPWRVWRVFSRDTECSAQTDARRRFGVGTKRRRILLDVGRLRRVDSSPIEACCRRQRPTSVFLRRSQLCRYSTLRRRAVGLSHGWNGRRTWCRNLSLAGPFFLLMEQVLGSLNGR